MLTNIEVVKKDGRSQSRFEWQKLVTACSFCIEHPMHSRMTNSNKLRMKCTNTLKLNQFFFHKTCTLPCEAARKVNAEWQKLTKTIISKNNHWRFLTSISWKLYQTGIVSDFNAKYIEDACQRLQNQSVRVTDQQLHDVCLKWRMARYVNTSVTVATSDLHRFVMGSLKKVDLPTYTAYKRYWQAQRDRATAFHELLQNEAGRLALRFIQWKQQRFIVISTKSAHQRNDHEETHAPCLEEPWMVEGSWRRLHLYPWFGDLYKDTFNCDLFDLEHLMKDKEHEDGFYFQITTKQHMNQNACHQPSTILSSA